MGILRNLRFGALVLQVICRFRNSFMENNAEEVVRTPPARVASGEYVWDKGS